jgi:PTH1 family peptidyl-tRNA hydrolase
MKLIVGLGNPGSRYANSRHNIGSSVVKALAKSLQAALRKEPGLPAFTAKVEIDGEVVLLAALTTFMNVSGRAVSALFKRYRLTSERLLLVCDDLDLKLGRLRLRPVGTAGGHRGLQAVITALGTSRFCRLRIGIGRPAARALEVAEYVLSNFKRKERAQVQAAILEAGNCCRLWASKGTQAAMNIFNRKERAQ